MLRVPRDVRDNSTVVEHTMKTQLGELGRSPSTAEVAEATGLTVEQVLEAREATHAYRCESLDRPVYDGADDGTVTLGDHIGTVDDGLRGAERAVLLEQLAAAALSDRDWKVVRLRIGEDLLQREIAERMGLSQMQVSRILREALLRLQLAAA
jgi:RNA polymerase sigma-B factor